MSNHSLKIILIFFCLFSLAFAFIIPPFEAPDESGHLNYVNFLQKHRTLPNQLTDSLKEPLQGHQPPLYYLTLYSINYLFHGDKNFSYRLVPNPLHVWNGGKNQHVPYYMHSDDSDKPDKFFYVFRVLSVLLGVLNLFFIYKIALPVLKDEKLALVPVVIAATLPQFAFISGVINNDNLVNLFSTLSIYYLLKAINRAEGYKYYILTGLFLGLGVITKKTIYFMFPVLAITLLIELFSKAGLQKKNKVKGFAIILLSAVIVSLPYIIRNIQIYQTFLGFREEYLTFGVMNSHSLFSYYFIDPFSHEFFKSMVGYPGMMNILLPKYIYAFYFILFATGFVMLIYRIKLSLTGNKPLLILFLMLLAEFAAIIYFNTLLSQFQGRFMFPVLAALTVLLSAGLIQFSELVKRKIRPYVFSYILISALVIFDIITIIITYRFYNTPSQYGM